MSGLDNTYCFIDSNILITTSPSTGGVLSGDGIIGKLFNPALAGTGYHIITLTYGTCNCMQIVDTIVFVSDELLSNTYFSNDSVCFGDIISIGSNASGGTGNYYFNWKKYWNEQRVFSYGIICSSHSYKNRKRKSIRPNN